MLGFDAHLEVVRSEDHPQSFTLHRLAVYHVYPAQHGLPLVLRLDVPSDSYNAGLIL